MVPIEPPVEPVLDPISIPPMELEALGLVVDVAAALFRFVRPAKTKAATTPPPIAPTTPVFRPRSTL